MHPGGLRTNMQVARDGADRRHGRRRRSERGQAALPERRPLLRARRRRQLGRGPGVGAATTGGSASKEGDVVSINVTYNVKRGDWIESMGIMATAWYPGHDDPLARDPFDDAAEVKAMVDEGGILTHGRLRENADSKARKDLGLPDPRKLPSQGPVPKGGIDIDSFVYSPGGFSAIRAFPQELMRPVDRQPRRDGQLHQQRRAARDAQHASRSGTASAPARRPATRAPASATRSSPATLRFDSGQLGYGQSFSSGVTTGSNEYTTPPLTKPGKTYTYFCRIHPFMRGSIRVRDTGKKKLARRAWHTLGGMTGRLGSPASRRMISLALAAVAPIGYLAFALDRHRAGGRFPRGPIRSPRCPPSDRSPTSSPATPRPRRRPAPTSPAPTAPGSSTGSPGAVPATGRSRPCSGATAARARAASTAS